MANLMLIHVSTEAPSNAVETARRIRPKPKSNCIFLRFFFRRGNYLLLRSNLLQKDTNAEQSLFTSCLAAETHKRGEIPKTEGSVNSVCEFGILCVSLPFFVVSFVVGVDSSWWRISANGQEAGRIIRKLSFATTKLLLKSYSIFGVFTVRLGRGVLYSYSGATLRQPSGSFWCCLLQ